MSGIGDEIELLFDEGRGRPFFLFCFIILFDRETETGCVPPVEPVEQVVPRSSPTTGVRSFSRCGGSSRLTTSHNPYSYCCTVQSSNFISQPVQSMTMSLSSRDSTNRYTHTSSIDSDITFPPVYN